MKEISQIIIIQGDGTPIFGHVVGEQQDENFDKELLSGLISAVQTFINALGEKSAEVIELGKSKFYLSKEENENLIFVLKSESNAKNKKMIKALEKIKDEFIETYSKFLKMEPNLRVHVLSAFHKDIDEIIGEN